MVYYFKKEEFESIKNGDALKKKVKGLLGSIPTSLSLQLGKSIESYWTSKSTFGFVLCDFQWSHLRYQRLIGRGEKDLFNKLKDDYDFILLTKTSDKNFRQIEVEGKKIIILNLDRFKEFISIIRNNKNTIQLFLYKFANKEQENVVRAWLKNYEKFDEIKEEVKSEETMEAFLSRLTQYKIKTVFDLDNLFRLGRIASNRIPQAYEIFKETLEEFHKLIESDAKEAELHDILFNNLWLIDFQYLNYSKKSEEHLGTGNTDITLYNDAIGIERVSVIELKKADTEIVTDRYRGENKPVILAEVGKAISQTIHYIEELKTKKRTIKGIVIIGRKREFKDVFIDKFNEYLHGVEVLTYDEIYERAKVIVEVFASKQI